MQEMGQHVGDRKERCHFNRVRVKDTVSSTGNVRDERTDCHGILLAACGAAIFFRSGIANIAVGSITVCLSSYSDVNWEVAFYYETILVFC